MTTPPTDLERWATEEMEDRMNKLGEELAGRR